MNHISAAPFLEDHAHLAAALPGGGPVAALRAAAAAAFRDQGLPHGKVEAWRYTRLKDLESTSFGRAAPAVVAAAPRGAGLAVEAVRIVLVNGRYAEHLSTPGLPAGVTVKSLCACLEAGDAEVLAALDGGADFAQAPMAALASAWLEDGAVLSVDAAVAVAPIVEVVALAVGDTPAMSFPRLLVRLGAGASLTLVETFTGPAEGVYAVNAVSEMVLGAGAALKHYVLQAEGKAATHVSLGRCAVPENGRYEGFVLQLGGKTARHEMRLKMVGAGGEAQLNGAYGVRGEAVCDTTTVVDHIAPETTTDQVFKGILDGRSKGVYQGRVQVWRDAQRIVGNQLHKALLLSRAAEVDCKPELEIYADDVKCSHGATVGELDGDQLFYLQARGIDAVTARALLMRAFIGEVLDTISDEAVRAAFAARADAWLDAEGAKR
ncbi:Fe-S cluster assembly protein SufD [Oleispirillum naphthae]|uniref:Fe-S cluster assembly protein SufD n=1 Tax=Oleispirillum naphthae TaxID=2838853 RepID=UPI0030824B00